MLHQFFNYSPWERKYSQILWGCVPPTLELNIELCIIPSCVANDAENSTLSFTKAGFHMLETSWTIRQGFHSLEKSLNFWGIP